MGDKEQPRNPEQAPDPASPEALDWASDTVKNPDDWPTEEEPMSDDQASRLKTLSEEAGESFDENLSKAQASKRIEELQEKTGHGKKQA